jgi:hypothetical protein
MLREDGLGPCTNLRPTRGCVSCLATAYRERHQAAPVTLPALSGSNISSVLSCSARSAGTPCPTSPTTSSCSYTSRAQIDCESRGIPEGSSSDELT